MHVITRRPLVTFAGKHGDSRAALEAWHTAACEARWTSLADVRRVYPQADLARVESGNTLTIFNVCGNKYRLITAIHYNRQTVFVLRILTHADYDKNHWKETL